ncbi:MAG: MGMT family protein [Spirochaetaceae bacterium]|jgi:methylated-DNA-protein-cysteine methyltransferase-like protein|nr:MGMT family protein [Spirochaetaceae bacterium]
MNEFSNECIKIISSIPKGKVMSYGQIAILAGSPRGARQVVRLLHSSSDKYRLPWHRVINGQGKISLDLHSDGELQVQLLESEGIEIGLIGKIDINKYRWNPDCQ